MSLLIHKIDSVALGRGPFIMRLIQKAYQFINVVNGVSHSHKTANIFFSFDSIAC